MIGCCSFIFDVKVAARSRKGQTAIKAVGEPPMPLCIKSIFTLIQLCIGLWLEEVLCFQPFIQIV